MSVSMLNMWYHSFLFLVCFSQHLADLEWPAICIGVASDNCPGCHLHVPRTTNRVPLYVKVFKTLQPSTLIFLLPQKRKTHLSHTKMQILFNGKLLLIVNIHNHSLTLATIVLYSARSGHLVQRCWTRT